MTIGITSGDGSGDGSGAGSGDGSLRTDLAQEPVVCVDIDECNPDLVSTLNILLCDNYEVVKNLSVYFNSSSEQSKHNDVSSLNLSSQCELASLPVG